MSVSGCNPGIHRDVFRFPPSAEPVFQHIRQFLREGDGIRIRRQQQVGIERRPIPLFQVFISQDTERSLDPEEEIRLEMRVLGADPASPR